MAYEHLVPGSCQVFTERSHLLNSPAYLSQMSSVSRLFLCALLTGLGAMPAQHARAQASSCPYEYFELPAFYSLTNSYVFSFQIRHNGQQEWVCAEVEALHGYFEKYEGLDPGMATGQRLVDLMTKGRVLDLRAPLGSLSFTVAATTTAADAIAAKGEAYFLHYYFTAQGCLREDRQVSEAAVMKHLQRWCILAFHQHETGCLMYAVRMQRVTK